MDEPEPVPRVSYDDRANAAYVSLYSALAFQPVVSETIPVTPDLNIDLDPDGRLVGVEVLRARELLRPEVLSEAVRRNQT